MVKDGLLVALALSASLVYSCMAVSVLAHRPKITVLVVDLAFLGVVMVWWAGMLAYCIILL